MVTTLAQGRKDGRSQELPTSETQVARPTGLVPGALEMKVGVGREDSAELEVQTCTQGEAAGLGPSARWTPCPG